jgi:hypothetical protein
MDPICSFATVAVANRRALFHKKSGHLHGEMLPCLRGYDYDFLSEGVQWRSLAVISLDRQHIICYVTRLQWLWKIWAESGRGVPSTSKRNDLWRLSRSYVRFKHAFQRRS